MAFDAQLRGLEAAPKSGKEGAFSVISRLGYIQIDTISVIERAHEHTIGTRVPGYIPGTVFDLLKDRRIFEYWGHQASFLPIEDYRYYLPMKRSFLSRSGWARRQFEDHRSLVDEVVERIRTEGPLGTKDFATPPGENRSGWWDWKPAKRVLEALYWKGDLMISERRGFSKIYDLTERVLPPGVDTEDPDEDEVAAFAVRRALAAHGFASESETRGYLQIAGRKSVSGAFSRMLAEGEIIKVSIKGLDKQIYYAVPEIFNGLAEKKPSPAGVVIFSPFDNMIIDRARLLRLFGFDYKLECFLPAAKRRFGYFSLPVAWNGEFCCRFDPKAERKTGVFLVKNLVFEKSFDDYDGMLPSFVTALEDFARFNGCSAVEIIRTEPARLKTRLKRALR